VGVGGREATSVSLPTPLRAANTWSRGFTFNRLPATSAASALAAPNTRGRACARIATRARVTGNRESRRDLGVGRAKDAIREGCENKTFVSMPIRLIGKTSFSSDRRNRPIINSLRAARSENRWTISRSKSRTIGYRYARGECEANRLFIAVKAELPHGR